MSQTSQGRRSAAGPTSSVRCDRRRPTRCACTTPNRRRPVGPRHAAHPALGRARWWFVGAPARLARPWLREVDPAPQALPLAVPGVLPRGRVRRGDARLRAHPQGPP